MRRSSIIIVLGLLSLLAACTKPTTEAKPALSQGPTDAEIYIVHQDGVQVVQVTANDSMHFNGDRFSVVTGLPVRVELTNQGTRPPTDMEHDFVILKPGTDALMFNLSCAQAKAEDYLPPDQIGKVFAHTPLAGPGQTVTAEFTAPAPGQYTFLCNFPGHYAAGMHGTMTVTPPPALPTPAASGSNPK